MVLHDGVGMFHLHAGCFGGVDPPHNSAQVIQGGSTCGGMLTGFPFTSPKASQSMITHNEVKGLSLAVRYCIMKVQLFITLPPPPPPHEGRRSVITRRALCVESRCYHSRLVP